MWILPLVGYLGLILGLSFLTLAIASGLYYLSELVEEHTVLAKKTLTVSIYAVIGIQILLLLVDRVPVLASALSIASHLVYSLNLRRFPIVKLADPIFILSCILVLVNHWVWFNYFKEPTLSLHNYDDYRRSMQRSADTSFTEIASFFGLQVWLVPFAFFISLSASENVLPSMGSEYATGAGSSYMSPGMEPSSARGKGPTNSGMAKAAVNGARVWIQDTGEAMGLWKGEKSRAFLHQN